MTETVSRKELLNSKIISSLQPKVGKQFENLEVEQRKQNILQGTRKKLILLAIDEKEAELKKTTKQFEKMKQNYLSNNENSNKFLAKMDSQIRTLTQKLNTNMNKKICFHIGQQQTFIIFVKKKIQSRKKRKWTINRKRKNRINYKNKLRTKKKNKLSAQVAKIKENNTVINLSPQEIPDSVYIFLSKGLGYVPSQKVDMQDLKYDTAEFIRKLTWKAFFKANPHLKSNDQTNSLHSNIRVSS